MPTPEEVTDLGYAVDKMPIVAGIYRVSNLTVRMIYCVLSYNVIFVTLYFRSAWRTRLLCVRQCYPKECRCFAKLMLLFFATLLISKQSQYSIIVLSSVCPSASLYVSLSACRRTMCLTRWRKNAESSNLVRMFTQPTTQCAVLRWECQKASKSSDVSSAFCTTW